MYKAGKSCKKREFEAQALVHLDALYRVARRMTNSSFEAEELVQEVFYRAYRAFWRFRRGTNCKAWLFKILYNVSCTRKMAEQKSRDNLVVMAASSHQPDQAANPERIVSARFEIERVRKALDRLPEDYRMVLLLTDVEGLSYKQTAQVMGSPVGTVRSRLARARALLRGWLEGPKHIESSEGGSL